MEHNCIVPISVVPNISVSRQVSSFLAPLFKYSSSRIEKNYNLTEFKLMFSINQDGNDFLKYHFLHKDFNPEKCQ